MTLNSAMLKNIVAVAKEVMSKETQHDLTEMKAHFGGAYTELDAVAAIAVEIGLRLYGVIDVSTRAVSPLSALAEHGAELYKQRYAL
jgi:hypothetical protein